MGALALRARVRSDARRIAIVGPSGAGKSTLLCVFAGLEPRARGPVRFAGELWRAGRRELVPRHRRRICWEPQDVRLSPRRSVAENLRFAGAPPEKALALAASSGINPLLARALLSGPRLLLLDEPFAALDRTRRADLASILRRVLDASGAALVLVSHDERDVASLADAVFELVDGTVVGVPAG